MLATLIDEIGRARGLDVELVLDAARVPVDDSIRPALALEPTLARSSVAPWLPGFVREAAEAPNRRRAQGVHHTPPELVEAILDEIPASQWTADAVVLDPSVGGGAFLLAAAERLAGSPRSVLARLRGVDIDPMAVAVTTAALTLWAGEAPRPGQVVEGDFLDLDPTGAPSIDLVVGNPPFRSQLRSGTVRSDERRALLRDRWPELGVYADDAAVFLLAAVDRVGERGTVALVQPSSVLGAADAAGVRSRLTADAPLRTLLVDHDRRFEAAVDTVAVVCTRDRSTSGRVAVVTGGVRHEVAAPDPASWAPLLAAAVGVPPPPPTEPGSATLADVATVTAGFRQHHYGLIPAVRDDRAGRHPLVTSGLIDPLHLRWGTRSCRFAKQRFDAPVVDPAAADPAIVDWVRDRLRPKVLVASQTKVLEAVVDPEGRLVPATPVVSVEPVGPDVSVWHLGALLTCPVASARMVTAAAGTALSADAVRVSAATLSRLPLPVDAEAWDRAAAAAARGDVEACGRAMLLAHECADRAELFDWWWDRNPTRSLRYDDDPR